MPLLTVPGSEQLPIANPGRPRMNARPFVDKALARGDLIAGATADVANTLDDFYQKLQKSKALQTAADADVAMQKLKVGYAASLVNKKNQPDSWVSGFQEQAQALQDQFSESDSMKGLNALQRQAITNNFRQFQADTSGELAQQAARRQINLTTSSVLASATEDARNGAEDGLDKALAKVDTLVKSGHLGPGDGEQRKLRLKSNFAQAQVDIGIGPTADAPSTFDTIEKMKAGKMPGWSYLNPKEQAQAMRHAESALNEKQRGNLNDLKKEMLDDPDYRPSKQELDQMVDHHLIGVKDADTLLKGIAATDQQNLNRSAESFQVVYTNRIFSHDWMSDPDPQKTAHDFESELSWMPPRYQLPLTKQIDDSLKQRTEADKKGVKAMEKPIAEDLMAKLDQDRAYLGRFTPGTLDKKPFTAQDDSGNEIPLGVTGAKGNTNLLKALKAMAPEDFEAKFGKGVTPQQVAMTEEYHYAMAKNSLRAWLADPKNAEPHDTFEQRANDYRMSLVKPYYDMVATDKLSRPTTQPTPAQPNLSDADQKALKWAQANATDPRAAAIFKRLGY